MTDDIGESMAEITEDFSNDPDYYQRARPAVQALPYFRGAAVKYVVRAGKKTPDHRMDLLKAIDCLAIELDDQEIRNLVAQRKALIEKRKQLNQVALTDTERLRLHEAYGSQNGDSEDQAIIEGIDWPYVAEGDEA